MAFFNVRQKRGYFFENMRQIQLFFRIHGEFLFFKIVRQILFFQSTDFFSKICAEVPHFSPFENVWDFYTTRKIPDLWLPQIC